MDARPKRLEDLVLTDVVRSLFTALTDITQLTSLLLHGGPGVGKTSAIECICAELEIHNPQFRKNRDVLTLNASDDRGLETVRSTVAAFLRHGRDVPKILVLDEIDAMTLSAQRTLATVMQNHKAILFCTCNYLCRVDTALRDMCIMVQMPAPDHGQAIERLITQTGISREIASRVFADTRGDLRAARNYCGLMRMLPSDTVFLTTEQRLNNAIIELCKRGKGRLVMNRALLRELEMLLTMLQVPTQCRKSALEELATALELPTSQIDGETNDAVGQGCA